MYEETVLTDEERERLFRVAESSLRVHRMGQFFVWTQGEMQTLVPHEILVFGMSRSAGSRVAFRKLASTPDFRVAHLAELCRPGDGLLDIVMAHWHRVGEPCMLWRGDDGVAHGEPGWLEFAEKNELRNLVAHGVRGGDGRICSFFSFSRIGVQFGPRLALRVRLLTPYLHETAARVLMEGDTGTIRVMRSDIRVTDREAEILRWIRDGKTNRDIATILGLSSHTVKNHVKKITRKMGASNRSHAVARAFTMGILSPGDS